MKRFVDRRKSDRKLFSSITFCRVLFSVLGCEVRRGYLGVGSRRKFRRGFGYSRGLRILFRLEGLFVYYGYGLYFYVYVLCLFCGDICLGYNFLFLRV